MSEQSLIGLTLAGFRLTGVIGEGGMATVYRGLEADPEGSKAGEYAVKIMNPDLAKESRFVRRFRREAKAAQMLKHPNTVHIVQSGVDQGYVFMVMELLQGFDLAMLLHRERRIPAARAVQIVVQVCRALSAAHEQSIVHRDLKPDNIMLVRQPAGVPAPVPGMNPTDFVKVLDFGIAKILDDEPGAPVDSRIEPITQEKSMLTRVGTIVGTPAYMAPEQGRAEAVDARTDLYACGVLLYELITGRVPFTGETPMQVVMRHVNEPPRPPSEFCPVNKDLERLIMRALAKYPAERQQSAEEMAFDLLGVLPKLGASAEKTESLVQRTLVMEPGPSPDPAPRPQQPRPAAGAPSKPLPAAGAPPRAAAAKSAPAPPKPAPAPAPAPAASPFPTLNIEVPDDLFDGLPPIPEPAPVTTAASAAPLPSTDPSPKAPPRAPPAPKAEPRVADASVVVGRAPVARTPAPVQVVRANAGTPSNLAQTMQSEPFDAPPPSSDDDDGATLVKAPTEVDRQRMSLAEEAMAKALGAAAPGPAHAAAPKVPSVIAPEGAEPNLLHAIVGGAGSPPRAAPAPPKPGDRGGLHALQETLKVEPETPEDPLAGVGTEVSLLSPPPASPKSNPRPADNAATISLAEDKVQRKPTGELIPINLPEERQSVRPEKPDVALWQPAKSRKLGGAAALLIGVLIGALLVATALIVALSLRR